MIYTIQPLPFYDRLSEQDRFKENSFGISKYLSDKRLIPFQIPLQPDMTSVSTFRIVGFKYAFEIDLSINEDMIRIIDTNLGRKCIFFGGEGIVFRRLTNYPQYPPQYSSEPLDMCVDYYHFELKFNNNKTLYSEKFYLNGGGMCDSRINLEIEAWNDKDIYDFTFIDGFKFRAYFDSFITNQIGEPTDEFLPDGYERNILSRRVIQFPLVFEVDPLPFSIANGLLMLTGLSHFVVKENGNEYIADIVTLETTQIEGSSFAQSVFKVYLNKENDLLKTLCS